MPTLVTPLASQPERVTPSRPSREASAKINETRNQRTTPTRSVHLATRSWCPTLKMVFDWTFAAALLVVVSPFIALAALLVKLTSRGPAFYSQVRLGKNALPFWIYKIRT